jgi:hypothetical protein
VRRRGRNEHLAVAQEEAVGDPPLVATSAVGDCVAQRPEVSGVFDFPTEILVKLEAGRGDDTQGQLLAITSGQLLGGTRKIRNTTLTRVKVLNTFKHKVRAQRDCDPLCK